MKKISVAGVVLAILACCFLSGCSGVLKNERMDQEVEQVIAALNEDDADRIFQSMYPGVITQRNLTSPMRISVSFGRNPTATQRS